MRLLELRKCILESPDSWIVDGEIYTYGEIMDGWTFGVIGDTIFKVPCDMWSMDKKHSDMLNKIFLVKAKSKIDFDHVSEDEYRDELLGAGVRFDKLTSRTRKKLTSLNDHHRRNLDISGRYDGDEEILLFWNEKNEVDDDMLKRIIDFVGAEISKVRMQFIDMEDDEYVYYKDYRSNNTPKTTQKSQEEINQKKAQLHVKPDMKLSPKERAEKKSRGKGFGSDKKKGGTTPTRYHQMRRTSEGVLTNESPDDWKLEDAWHDPYSIYEGVTFGIIADTLFFIDYGRSTPDITHWDILNEVQKIFNGKRWDDLDMDNVRRRLANKNIKFDNITAKTFREVLAMNGSKHRNQFDVAGRYSGDHGVMLFWNRRNEFPKSIIERIAKTLKVDLKDTKFQFVDMNDDKYLDYDDVFEPSKQTSQKTDDEIRKIMARLHVKPDSELTPEERKLKKARGKGFGSDKKIGGTTPTRYHQMRRTSESALNESPDWTKFKNKMLHWEDMDAYAFGTMGDTLFVSNESGDNHAGLIDKIREAYRKSKSPGSKLNFKQALEEEEVDVHGYSDGTSELFAKRFFDGKNFEISGRLWLENKVISFWNKIDEVPVDLMDRIVKIFYVKNPHVQFRQWNNGELRPYKEFLDYKSGRKSNDKPEPVKSLHTVAAKKKAVKGFGSDKKIGGTTATQYRQKISTSD